MAHGGVEDPVSSQLDSRRTHTFSFEAAPASYHCQVGTEPVLVEGIYNKME